MSISDHSVVEMFIGAMKTDFIVVIVVILPVRHGMCRCYISMFQVSFNLPLIPLGVVIGYTDCVECGPSSVMQMSDVNFCHTGSSKHTYRYW